MNPKELRIVFMGTPAIAAYSLMRLHQEGFNVVGVVTAPDKPAGRGLKLMPSEVKSFASGHGIPVLQPEKLKSPEFLNELEKLQPDVQVVVAFRMLPEAVWTLPALGTFNMHASLLPQYRGAAPINRVIINGEKITGVTTFMLDKEIDTGKILLQESMPITANETAGSLHDRIMVAGAELVIKTINELAAGNLNPIDQSELIIDPQHLKKAPKVFKEDCLIDWKNPCVTIVNLIHGLNPVPGAFAMLKDGNEEFSVKIFEAEPKAANHSHNSGEIFTDQKNTLAIATPNGYVIIKSLQVSGKKRMKVDEFLRGFRFKKVSLPPF